MNWLSILMFRTFLSTPSARRATARVSSSGFPGKIFLSTPSARRATAASAVTTRPTIIFLSTPSARRATCPHNPSSKPHWYFYPRPPRGGRHKLFIHTAVILNFYPRPPRGGRLGLSGCVLQVDLISIHALREEGDMFHGTSPCSDSISIHALREEGDPRRCRSGSYGIQISIHALREEGDVLCAN